jgi:hypothetical protein
MIDDPLEWLAVTLDEEDPTIPDALEWRDSLDLDDETHRITALDDDAPPEAEWELELESDLLPRLGVTRG